MRFIINIFFLLAVGYGAYYLDQKDPMLKEHLLNRVYRKKCLVFDERVSAQQLIEKETGRLFKSKNGTEIIVDQIFHPYLLMRVKWLDPNKMTQEGHLLWDLMDGEMVLDTASWEKTRGFGDCIRAGAQKDEYALVLFMQKSKGKVRCINLVKKFNEVARTGTRLLKSAEQKQLIFQDGDYYRLHIANPYISVNTLTRFHAPLLSKKKKCEETLLPRYRIGEIKKGVLHAFGSNCVIRDVEEVFLPIHQLTTYAKGGTALVSYWNGLNGKEMPSPL